MAIDQHHVSVLDLDPTAIDWKKFDLPKRRYENDNPLDQRGHRLPVWVSVVLFVVAGYTLPAIVGWIYGPRDPKGQLATDESCYLVQADTFASGRLTNPTPPHFEFFESPHLLFTPTYQAKYQPAQGLFLAIGQRFFGHPIHGVWLSCGCFAGALYWMLCGWMPRRWALLGTLHAVGVIGVTTYWSQSYWGGMVSALGGALVLGGTAWTIRRGQPSHGFWTAVGVVTLASSRPFEGSIVCLGCAPLLTHWLVKGSLADVKTKLLKWCGPFALILAMGVTLLGIYNQAVTGNWRTMPYGVYHKQYFSCGLFRWQPLDQEPERKLTTHAAAFFAQNPGQPGGPRLGIGPMLEAALGPIFKGPGQFFYHFKFLDRKQSPVSPTRLLEYLLIAAYLAAIFQSLYLTRHWGWLRFAHILLVCGMVAGSTVWWKLLHYRAPYVCLYYFLSADLLRRLAIALGRSSSEKRMSLEQVSTTICLAMTILIPITWVVWGTDNPTSDLPGVTNNVSTPEADQILTRSQLIRKLESGAHPALAFVSYDPDVSAHTEWVYNSSNLQAGRVLLAHDMGAEHNEELIQEFPDREKWRVRVTKDGAVLRPYDVGE